MVPIQRPVVACGSALNRKVRLVQSQCRAHTLRHSAAVAWRESGVHIKAVADLLGHSSIAMPGDVYGHNRALYAQYRTQIHPAKTTPRQMAIAKRPAVAPANNECRHQFLLARPLHQGRRRRFPATSQHPCR